MDEKFCRDCASFVSRAGFTPCKSATDGLQSYCRACYAKRAAERRKRNPERAKKLAASYSSAHRDEINARRRARRSANPERTKAERKAVYAKYREKELETMRKWKEANRDHMRVQRAERYWSDPDAARKRQMDYLRARPGLSNSRVMARLAQKLKATPPWANKESIESFYGWAEVLSSVAGVPHEVDHVVPLRAKNVSGLHCEANLQILTRAENRKKSNHFNTALAA